MIPKISNNQNKPTFTSIMFNHVNQQNRESMNELSQVNEYKWLNTFLKDIKKEPPKYIDTFENVSLYQNKNGGKIMLETLFGMDCLYVSSPEGKSTVIALDDSEIREDETYTDIIEPLYNQIKTILKR